MLRLCSVAVVVVCTVLSFLLSSILLFLFLLFVAFYSGGVSVCALRPKCECVCVCVYEWVCLYGFSDQSFHTCFISGGEQYISAAGFACWRSFKACLPTSQHIDTILFSETFSFFDDLFSCVVSLTHRKRKKKRIFFIQSFLIRKI